MIEEFTAVAMCPKCNHVAIHLWRDPKPLPMGADVLDVAQRKILSSQAALNELWGSPPPYDPADAVVVRQCQHCGWEWSQK